MDSKEISGRHGKILEWKHSSTVQNTPRTNLHSTVPHDQGCHQKSPLVIDCTAWIWKWKQEKNLDIFCLKRVHLHCSFSQCAEDIYWHHICYVIAFLTLGYKIQFIKALSHHSNTIPQQITKDEQPPQLICVLCPPISPMFHCLTC